MAGRKVWSHVAHQEDEEAVPDFASDATGILLEKHAGTSLGEIGVGIAQIAASNAASVLQASKAKKNG